MIIPPILWTLTVKNIRQKSYLTLFDPTIFHGMGLDPNNVRRVQSQWVSDSPHSRHCDSESAFSYNIGCIGLSKCINVIAALRNCLNYSLWLSPQNCHGMLPRSERINHIYDIRLCQYVIYDTYDFKNHKKVQQWDCCTCKVKKNQQVAKI